MTCSRIRHVMFNLKMEPRWNSEIGQVLHTNAKEDKKLKLQITRINTAKKEQLGKIDQEMMSLRRQLLEDRKILGTRSDVKRREEDNCDEKELRNSIQPKLMGPLQTPEVIDRRSFKPFHQRPRQKLTVEQLEPRQLSPSRIHVSAGVKEGSAVFRRRLSEVSGKRSPTCSTPAARYPSRRHSIAEINFSDSLSKLCSPRTSSARGPNNTNLSSGKVGHPLLRQRRASLPHAMIPERPDHLSTDLPKLNPIKLFPEKTSKLATDDSRANQNVKVGKFSRHVDGDARYKRRNSLPNFGSFASNQDSSVVSKERLTARLVSKAKLPGSSGDRNIPAAPAKHASIFGRHQKYPTPVSERSNEGNWAKQEDSDSLDSVSMADENENTVGQEPEQDQELSSAQELSFIPKATLQEKMNKFFMEWVEGSDEEPRTDIEELLQEFRKEKKEEGREELNERMDEDIGATAQDIAVPEEPQ